MVKQAVPISVVFKNPIHFLAFGFGSGCSPVAPGTFGSVAAIPCYFLFMHLSSAAYAGLLLVSFIFGVWICGRSAEMLKVHDHPGIVWDEFVGMWLTLAFAPPGWLWVVIGFVLFRVFDIVKPWPIRIVDQRVSGGFGIMFDDILAAIYAIIVLQLLATIFAT